MKASQHVSTSDIVVKKRKDKKLIALILLFLMLATGGLLINKPTGRFPLLTGAFNKVVQDIIALKQHQKYALSQNKTLQQIPSGKVGDNSSLINKKRLTTSFISGTNEDDDINESPNAIIEQNDKLNSSSTLTDQENLLPTIDGVIEKIQIQPYQKRHKSFIKKDSLKTFSENLIGRKKSGLDQSGGFPGKKQWYAGVVAGPDFSKVNSGSFSNSGITGGIVAGLQLSKKISFETGVSWHRKNYTTTGDQFNMDKIKTAMPTGMVINTVQGKSSLIEIPLKIKYNLLQKAHADFFFTGGVAAYIMTNESNMYNVTMAGSNEKMYGNYRDNNYALPAVAAISIGYERTVFRYTNLRIEPFLTFPLQGIGVGKLPVTSAGMQFGIVRRIK